MVEIKQVKFSSCLLSLCPLWASTYALEDHFEVAHEYISHAWRGNLQNLHTAHYQVGHRQVSYDDGSRQNMCPRWQRFHGVGTTWRKGETTWWLEWGWINCVWNPTVPIQCAMRRASCPMPPSHPLWFRDGLAMSSGYWVVPDEKRFGGSIGRRFMSDTPKNLWRPFWKTQLWMF
jgi:hypothetical protein